MHKNTRALTDAARQQTADGWLTGLVFERLCGAARTAQISGKHPGPSTAMTMNIVVKRDGNHDADSDVMTRRTAATPTEITMMEEAMVWPSRYILNETQRTMLAQLVRARAIGGNYRRICRERGWGKTRAYDTCNVALRLIASGLNRDGVPVRV